MKLFISFLIALATVLFGVLITQIIKGLIRKYGYSVVENIAFKCCLIALLTVLIYLSW